MAAGAEYGRIELVRLHGRVIRVRGQCSVARLAIHMRMLAIFLLIEDVGMAGFTALVASESDGSDSNFGYRVAAIVPVLSEAFRDHRVPDDEKQEQAGNEDPCQSKKVSCIFEDIHGMLSAAKPCGRSAIQERAEADPPR
jgi:hypothetical protein